MVGKKLVNSRQKGAKCEDDVRVLLESRTLLPFERTPGSGSGIIKGDLHVPGKKNFFCIEIKHYAESAFNDKIFTSKTNNFVLWWNKLVLQSKEKHPLLIFKYNRSKYFVSTDIKPTNTNNYVDIHWLNCYTLLLDEWLGKEKITWMKI